MAPGARPLHHALVTKGRLEAFSDAVIAIVMTIMVLELVPPHGATLGDLAELSPIFTAYVLSFANLAIYWNNHHHLLQAARTVSGKVLWANMLLLFALSLIPFATAWIGETTFAPVPMAVYGLILISAAFAYFLLVRALLSAPGQTDTLATAIGSDRKGKISPAIYAVAIAISLFAPLVAFALYVFVAVMWIVPDPRIERRIAT
jgi:TMEM175 potassium channel family protein